MNDSPVPVVLGPQELKEEALSLFTSGEYPQAIERFEQARDAFVSSGDAAGGAEMLNNLGVVYQRLARWDDALKVLKQAAAAFARLEDPRREAQALGNLGSLYLAKGDRKRGAALLQEAAGMFRALGERELHSATLRALSRASLRGGDVSGALNYYEAGLTALSQPSVGQRALRGLLALPARLRGVTRGQQG